MTGPGTRLAAVSRSIEWGRGAPLFLGLLAIVVFVWPGANEALEYSRPALLDGELWRVVTGHWSHASLDHLGWDVLVFIALGCALGVRNARVFWGAIIASSVAIPAALLVLGPGWQAYRGLSGIDTALFVALAAILWLDNRAPGDRWLAGIALVLLTLKLAIEGSTGSPLFAAGVPGYEVVPLAHVAGAAAGLAAVGQRLLRERPANTVRRRRDRQCPVR